MNWKPNKWIAGLLGLFFSPIGMLYIAKPKLFIVVFVINFILVILGFFYFSDWFIIVNWFFYFMVAIYAYKSAISIEILRPWYSKWYGILIITFIFIMPLFVGRTFYYEPFHIPASSMAPTINIDDYIIVKKHGCGNYKLYGIPICRTESNKDCKVDRGDIIVFVYPQDHSVDYIKRVVAIGGDIVSYKDKVLIINDVVIEDRIIETVEKGSILKEKIGNHEYSIKHTNNTKSQGGYWKIPQGFYFVLGDNRDNSADSRHWGFVPEQNIIGKLYHVFE